MLFPFRIAGEIEFEQDDRQVPRLAQIPSAEQVLRTLFESRRTEELRDEGVLRRLPRLLVSALLRNSAPFRTQAVADPQIHVQRSR